MIWRFQFSLNFSKIFWFRDFMSKFSRNDSQWLRNGCPKKFQTFKIYKHLKKSILALLYFRSPCNTVQYVPVTWAFICNLF